MKAFEGYFGNLYNGIRVYTNPFAHVSLGRSKGKHYMRIPLGIQDVAKLITTVPYTGTAGTKDVSLLRTASVLFVPKKGSTTGEKQTLLVFPRQIQADSILVKWAVPSGVEGRAEIGFSGDVQVLGHDKSLAENGKGEIDEVLVVLRPKQKLTAYRTGTNVKITDGSLAWDGKELRLEFGFRTVIVNTETDEITSIQGTPHEAS